MRLVRPVHFTDFAPRLVHFYSPCHVATCLFDPGDSARCRPGCRSRSRRPSVLSWSSESGPTAARCVRVAVVQVTGTLAACCLRRGGAACPARYGHFDQVVWPGRGPACQRLASAGESSVSNSWSPRVPSRPVLSSSARWPSVGRLVTARFAGPRPQQPCLARLPSAPGSVLPERC